MRDRLLALVAQGPLPLPGAGRTAARLAALADASRGSLGLGRLLEAHADAEAILAEAGVGPAGRWGLLGVWASDRHAGVRLERDGAAGRLVGTKPFCSGAPLLDHALVTADGTDGVELCLVDLTDAGLRIEPSQWVGPGMRSTETRAVRFDGARGVPVGAPGWYLERAGFWHGAVGVAASWFGGALGVLATMAEGIDPDDRHQLALLGDAEAARYSMEAVLERGAREIDRDPDDRAAARARALRIRRVVADGCLQVVRDAGEALGPRALAFDGDHAQRVADLEVYVRQEHGRHDSEQIGRTVASARRRPC